MCAPKQPKVPEPPKQAPAPDAPEVSTQTQALTPQETITEQALGARLGLNQFRIIPGVSLTKL
jgi:hypothetical protein